MLASMCVRGVPFLLVAVCRGMRDGDQGVKELNSNDLDDLDKQARHETSSVARSGDDSIQKLSSIRLRDIDEKVFRTTSSAILLKVLKKQPQRQSAAGKDAKNKNVDIVKSVAKALAVAQGEVNSTPAYIAFAQPKLEENNNRKTENVSATGIDAVFSALEDSEVEMKKKMNNKDAKSKEVVNVKSVVTTLAVAQEEVGKAQTYIVQSTTRSPEPESLTSLHAFSLIPPKISDKGQMRDADDSSQHLSSIRFSDKPKEVQEDYSAQIGLSSLCGALLCLCCMCCCCPSMEWNDMEEGKDQPDAPPPPLIDEGLVKEAAYLKRSHQFPRPLCSRVEGGVRFFTVFFSVLILLIGLLTVGISLQCFSCYVCAPSGVIFATISLTLYLLFLLWGTLRWRNFFKDLPQRQDKDSVLRTSLPKNTLSPRAMSMRPLWMSCLQYLWCMHAIYVSFFCVAMYRLYTSNSNTKKIRAGQVKPNQSVEETLGIFMLETTAFLWFKDLEEQKDGKVIGHFSSIHLGPIRTPLNGNGLHDIGNVEIWVDLKARKAVRSTIDHVEIKISRAFVLVLYMMIGSGHAWLHAVCSWAVLPESNDPFIRKMSLCTMFFSHLGFDGGIPILAEASQRPDYVKAGNQRSVLFADILPYNDEDYMLGPYQAGVQDFFTPELAAKLVPYSRFCAWSYLLYKPFMELFKAETTTMSLSPLSYFYLTVLHCTDHWALCQLFTLSMGDWANVVIPTEDAQTTEYSAEEPHIDYWSMSPVFLISAGGLSEDFPKMYNVYFRDAPEHIGFYKKVYELAKYLDPELAYHLQACIIK